MEKITLEKFSKLMKIIDLHIQKISMKSKQNKHTHMHPRKVGHITITLLKTSEKGKITQNTTLCVRGDTKEHKGHTSFSKTVLTFGLCIIVICM